MTPLEMLPGFKREPLLEATPGSKRTAVEVPKPPGSGFMLHGPVGIA